MPGYTITEERDGLACYVVPPPAPLPPAAPQPPRPLPAPPPLSQTFDGPQADSLRAGAALVAALKRAQAARAAGDPEAARAAELDARVARDAAAEAKQRAADAHGFGARMCAEVYPDVVLPTIERALRPLLERLDGLFAGRAGRGAA